MWYDIVVTQNAGNLPYTCSSVNFSGEEGSTGWITTELQVLAPVSCAINPWVHYLSRALIRSPYYFSYWKLTSLSQMLKQLCISVLVR